MSSGRIYLKDAYNAIYENDFQKAIEFFKKAISCEPTNASYYYKLSITHSRNGEIKEAFKAAQMANELQPKSQLYRYHLQILQSKEIVLKVSEQMKNGTLTNELEELLNFAKQLDPLNIEAYLLLGIYYGEKNELRLALRELNYILNLDPYNQEARHLKKYYINLNNKGGIYE